MIYIALLKTRGHFPPSSASWNIGWIREPQKNHQYKRKEYADTKRRHSSIYNPEDCVLVNTHILNNRTQWRTSKFETKRDGAYVILQERGPCSFEIATSGNPTKMIGVYHTSALTLFHGSEDQPPNPFRPLQKKDRPKRSRALKENRNPHRDDKRVLKGSL